MVNLFSYLSLSQATTIRSHASVSCRSRVVNFLVIIIISITTRSTRIITGLSFWWRRLFPRVIVCFRLDINFRFHWCKESKHNLRWGGTVDKVGNLATGFLTF